MASRIWLIIVYKGYVYYPMPIHQGGMRAA